MQIPTCVGLALQRQPPVGVLGVDTPIGAGVGGVQVAAGADRAQRAAAAVLQGGTQTGRAPGACELGSCCNKALQQCLIARTPFQDVSGSGSQHPHPTTCPSAHRVHRPLVGAHEVLQAGGVHHPAHVAAEDLGARGQLVAGARHRCMWGNRQSGAHLLGQ